MTMVGNIPMVMIGACLFCGASDRSTIVASFARLSRFNGQQYINVNSPICQFVSHNGSLCSRQSANLSVAMASGAFAHRHSCALNRCLARIADDKIVVSRLMRLFT